MLQIKYPTIVILGQFLVLGIVDRVSTRPIAGLEWNTVRGVRLASYAERVTGMDGADSRITHSSVTGVRSAMPHLLLT